LNLVDKNYGDYMPESMMLVKYLSHAGYCSRRQAVELIKLGKVKVNGHVVTEPWHSINNKNKVQVGKTQIFQAPKEYILLNKPAGYITTMADDQGRNSVASLIHTASPFRLYPVGRLDKETRGLLLFTNDGELANKLSHPSFEVGKVYLATLHEPAEFEHLQALAKGIRLKDGFIKADAISYMPGKGKNYVRVHIHSGKNRIVRRMFERFGYEVISLDRIRYAGLTQKGLQPGSWRRLNKKEMSKLLQSADTAPTDKKTKGT